MSMKVIIIEDEPLQAKQLQKVLKRVDESIEVLAVLESIDDSVSWLSAQDRKSTRLNSSHRT